MEQTPAYKKTLDKIRKMPQETEGEKTSKHEKARDFRMEVMFDNARCAELVIGMIKSRPGISFKEVAKKLRSNSKFLAHPAELSNFISKIKMISRDVQSGVDTIEAIAEQENKNAAEVLFDSLRIIPKNDGEKSPGNLEIDTSYPLALVMYVPNAEDYAKIDKRTNIAGYFHSAHGVTEAEEEYSDAFPLVVVNGLCDRDRVTLHEKGHAENNLDKLSSGSFRWVRGFVHYEEVENLIKLSKIGHLFPKQKIKKQVLSTRIKRYIFACAKDELLAEYRTEFRKEEGELGFVYGKLTKMFQKGGVYDYINGLGINEKNAPKLYSDLWEEYKVQLMNACTAMMRVATAYGSTQLFDRSRLFRWVLAQVPLEGWDQQLKDNGFYAEAKELASFHKPAASGGMRFKERAGYVDLIKELSANQFRSLMPIIQKHKKESK